MTIKEIVRLLDGNKSSGMVMVHFKERDSRFPMVGRFVYLNNDGNELADKGWVRFVNQTRTDYWSDEAPQVGLTKLFKFEDFSLIKIL